MSRDSVLLLLPPRGNRNTFSLELGSVCGLGAEMTKGGSTPHLIFSSVKGSYLVFSSKPNPLTLEQ